MIGISNRDRESIQAIGGIWPFTDKLRFVAVYWMGPGECQVLSQPVSADAADYLI